MRIPDSKNATFDPEPLNCNTNGLAVCTAKILQNSIPHLSVVCRPNPGTDSYHDEPAVIMEVISESTRRVDEFEKRDAYLSINSLNVYILLETTTAATLVYRRIDTGFATEIYEGIDAIIPLPEIGCSLNLAECYANVDFPPLAEHDHVQ